MFKFYRVSYEIIKAKLRDDGPLAYLRKLSLKEAKKYNVPIYRDEKGNIVSGNNELDAFRHSYSSAYMTHQFGNATSWLFGLGVEVFGKNPKNERLMDFYNNRVGRAIGRNAKRRGISLDNLGGEVYRAYRRGDLVLSPPLSRDDLPEENSFFNPEIFKSSESNLEEKVFDTTNEIFKGLGDVKNNIEDRIFFYFDSARPMEEQAAEFRDYFANMFKPEIEQTIKDTFAEFFAAQSNAKYTGRITNRSHSQQMDGLMKFLQRGYRNL